MKKIFSNITECSCHLDLQHNEIGNQIFSYRLIPHSNSKKILFSNSKGCYLNKKQILYDDFESLNIDSPKQIKSFLEKYGFLYQFQSNSSIVISHLILHDLLKRIKELKNLMIIKKISDMNYSPSNALISIFYLLTHPITTFSDICNSSSKGTDIHNWNDSIYKSIELKNRNDLIVSGTLCDYLPTKIKVASSTNPTFDFLDDDRFFVVKDSISNREEYVHYMTLLTDLHSNNKSLSTLLTLLYCSIDRNNTIEASLTDLLYNLMTKHHVVIPFDNSSIDEFDSELSKKIDKIIQEEENLRNCMDKIILNIITKEFNYLCHNISCRIDPKDMSCIIVIPDLLSCLLVSISTILSQDLLVRTCAGCGKQFFVPNTNSKKIYHNTACGNRHRQKKHRLKGISS